MSDFSKSEFAALLDELIETRAREAEEGDGASAARGHASMPFSYVGTQDAAEAFFASVPGEVVADLYRQNARAQGAPIAIDNPPGIESPDPAPPLPSIDPAEIARELTLTANRIPHDIDRIRRAFAFANHPDRVDPALRERAEIRMRIANMLIDQVKKKVTKRRR
ncbi:hypothetical protein [Mesorhizobium xinjiangense]|uniref:hypothetical protein n=1 Tax=Mesorhizobium xinjiangense TaxID=2678685 RepID=UPI001F416DB4|nr:hypothetical protein [Mesorhizobium xinjiangense]